MTRDLRGRAARLRRLLNARVVAIVGASRDVHRVGHSTLASLIEGGCRVGAYLVVSLVELLAMRQASAAGRRPTLSACATTGGD